MNNYTKLFTIFLLNMLLAVPTYAKAEEKKTFQFTVEPEELLKGDIHYAFKAMRPRELARKFPEAIDLDSLGLLQEKDVRILLSKFVYVVAKPVGFFDQAHLRDEAYLDHVMGEQTIKKTGEDTYKIRVPGEDGLTYNMRAYFDSDDISTLPNSRVIQGVSAAKKLDVISQSASSIVFKEFTDHSRVAAGGTSVTSYIPLKENRTLVIAYHLTAMKMPIAKDLDLERAVVREAVATRDLIENYEKE